MNRHKEAAEALRESVEKFRDLANHIPVGVIQTSARTGEILFVNDAALRLFEFDSEEEFFAQRSPTRWKDPEGRERLVQLLREQGEVRDFEAVALTKTDRAKSVILSSQADGDTLLSTVLDITARKQAEESLQQRTAQVRLLFEAGQRLGQSLDLETIFATVHDVISQTMTCDGLVVSSYSQKDNLIRCTAMYNDGTPREVGELPPIPLEPEGKGTQSVAIRTGESLILADYRGHLQTAQTAYYVDEERMITYDEVPADEDVTRSALVVPLKSEGRVIGVVQVFSYRVDDFTEDDLALLEALSPQIAAAMTNALLYQQAQREIDERKRAEEKLREYREHLEELVAQRTAELNARVAEVEQLNRGMVNLTEDMQATNRSLESTTTRLQEVNQELSDFAYVVSHDLKAPLRAVTQLADWIATDYANALDEEGQEMLSLLISRTKRMHSLIQGILEYSRIGRVKEREKEVNLNWLVQDMIEMLAPPEHIQMTIKGELPSVVGEQTHLEQVFRNLLDNAVKFMDKPAGCVTIGCVDEGSHWLFSVADNGPGIEEKYHDKVFQMFQTLAPRDEFESTGVGLALVKKIVETGGGSIWLESEVGKGSTFYFTLPKEGEKNEGN